MTTILLIKQDIEGKARGALLHIIMYMGNDKFKTPKLADFRLPNDYHASGRGREHLWIFSSCQ